MGEQKHSFADYKDIYLNVRSIYHLLKLMAVGEQKHSFADYKDIYLNVRSIHYLVY